MSEHELKALEVWGDAELKQVTEACHMITRPLVEIEIENEDNLGEGDIAAIHVHVTRLNLKEGEEAGYIHSQAYPFLKKEILYVMCTDGTENKAIFAADSITSQARKT